MQAFDSDELTTIHKITNDRRNSAGDSRFLMTSLGRFGKNLCEFTLKKDGVCERAGKVVVNGLIKLGGDAVEIAMKYSKED
jgi:hypothetical protein